MYSVKIVISDFQKRAKKLGLSIKELCEEAGIEESMFYKWKQGKQAYIGSLEKIHVILTEYETTPST